MSNPVAVLKCDLCGEKFEMEMLQWKGRGYYPPDSNFSVISSTSKEDDDIETICLECESALLTALRKAVTVLRESSKKVVKK